MPSRKSELESRIAAFEARRGSQIAVLLLPTTKPEEIEQYAIRVAEAWKIGRRKIDDGLILVVAKDDRRLRIEVGYGLEGAIPDSIAKRVIDERITPRFREGDFYGGVRDGVDQLIRLAEGEKLPPPAAAPTAPGARPEPISFLHFFAGNPMFILILALVGGAILKQLLGRLPGSLAVAAGVGLLVLLLYGIGIAILAGVRRLHRDLHQHGRRRPRRRLVERRLLGRFLGRRLFGRVIELGRRRRRLWRRRCLGALVTRCAGCATCSWMTWRCGAPSRAP